MWTREIEKRKTVKKKGSANLDHPYSPHYHHSSAHAIPDSGSRLHHPSCATSLASVSCAACNTTRTHCLRPPVLLINISLAKRSRWTLTVQLVIQPTSPKRRRISTTVCTLALHTSRRRIPMQRQRIAAAPPARRRRRRTRRTISSRSSVVVAHGAVIPTRRRARRRRSFRAGSTRVGSVDVDGSRMLESA